MLPSIRRLQILLIYPTVEWTTRRPAFAISFPDAVVVVGQVAHFNLTPEASLCRGFYLLPFVLSMGWRAQMETFGQVACTVRRPARSVFCNAESAERYVCRCRARLRAPWILGWKNVYCPQSADYKYYWFTATAEWTTEVHSALRELNLLRLRSDDLGRYLPLPAHVSPRLCRVSTNLHNKQLLG